MKALTPQELRIGNFVTYKDYGTSTIVRLDSEGFCSILPCNWTGPIGKVLQEIEPIDLTEDWLKKFGFKKIEESPFTEDISLKYWVNNRVCLFFNESPPEDTWLIGWADQRFGKYSVVTGRWIHHVHELMNIHFALTGEELTISSSNLERG
jgi:hypothetical protein